MLAGIVQRISGIALKPADGSTNLFELGLDSLLLMQVKTALETEVGVAVEMGQFYGQLSTPAALAEHISAAMPAPAQPPQGLPVLPPAIAAEQLPIPVPTVVPVLKPMTPAAAAPVAAMPSAGSSDLVHLFDRQVALMERQLALLGGAPAVSSVPVAARLSAPVPAPAPVLAAAPAPTRAPVAAPVPAPVPGAQSKGPPVALDAGRQALLDDLVRRYTARTPRSKAYAAQARAKLGDWIATIGFRPELKEIIYPVVSVSSEGSHIQDLDGNDYIDLAMSFGVGFFGHRPPFVVDAVRARLERGFELATQSELAAENAALVCDLTGCERAVFSNTGTEAVMTAFRLARTVTGRRRVVHFTSAFHGFYDGVMAYGSGAGARPMVPGITPSQVEDVLVLEYGSPAALERIRAEAHTLAGVMVEPVQSRDPDLQPHDFLHALRAITEQHGVALIFDEMVNGFRIGPGGAQAYFGITADIVTYGKMVGGGLPVSIIAGRARFIDAIDGGAWQFGDDSAPSATMTFFGGTFCRHPLSMAATNAALRFMKAQGPALQDRLNQRTIAFATRLNATFQEEGAPFRAAWFSSQFQVRQATPWVRRHNRWN